MGDQGVAEVRALPGGAWWRSGGSGAAHGEGRIDRGSGWRRAVGEGSVGRSGVTVGSMPVQCVVGGGLGRFVSRQGTQLKRNLFLFNLNSNFLNFHASAK